MSRSKTQPGRLQILDQVLIAQEGGVLERRDGAWNGAPVVDVGLGALPWTTVELAEALDREFGPAPPVLGIDIDAAAVRRARPWARPGLVFVQADLVVPGVLARVVRVLNVLRDRPVATVPAAHQRLGEMVLDGGLILEGTCSPRGEVGVVHCLRKTADGLFREALWFWTDGSQGTAPLMFRDRLPRDLRRSVEREHPLGQLMAAWMRSHDAAAQGPGLKRLHASVRELGLPSLRVLAPGVVAWAPEGGVSTP